MITGFQVPDCSQLYELWLLTGHNEQLHLHAVALLDLYYHLIGRA